MNITGTPKFSIARVLLGLIIFALLVSLKIIIFSNLERMGLSYFDANSIRESWDAYSGEWIFYLIALLISMVFALTITIKT